MADSPGGLRLIVCRQLFRETEAALGSGGFDDVELRRYDQDCGRPPRPESLRARLSEACEEGADCLFLAGGCVPASIDASTTLPPNCRVRRVDQCFYFLADRALVDGLIAGGAYVLSPGWLALWRERLERWGFDRETARAFFAESATELVLLDTGLDELSAVFLEEFSDYVGLPRRSLPVGLEHFALALDRIVLEWRLERKSRELRAAEALARRKVSDQAMLFDLISGMTHMTTESEAIDQIMGLFDMLFATGKAAYASVTAGRVTACRARPEPAPSIEACQAWLDSGRKDGARAGEGDIFFRVAFRHEVLGLLEISGMEFPERSEEYFALAAPIAQVCGLAISNARMYQDLRTQAITDSLTGLINRRRLFEQGEGEVSRARRYGRPLAAVMIDIDYFKSVNDRHGHQAGDAVLAEVARVIRGELRSSDICARYGGEEFAVLMPETDSGIALQAAERIRARVEGLTVAFGDAAITTTLSLGVAMLGPSCADLEALLGRSDRALYESKRAGRNRVSAFDKRGS